MDRDPFYLECALECSKKLREIDQEMEPLENRLKRLRDEKDELQKKKRRLHREYVKSVLIPERILSLPDELLIKPLTYLSKKDLLRVACVCSKFNRLTNDQSLWRSLLLHDARIAYSTSKLPSWTKTVVDWKKECLQKCLIHIYEVGRKLSILTEDQSNKWALLEPLYFPVRALRQRICSFLYLPPHKVRVRVSLTKPIDKETDWGFFLDDLPKDTTIKQLGFKGMVADIWVSVERIVDFAESSHGNFWYQLQPNSVGEDSEYELWIPTEPYFVELSQAELMLQLDAEQENSNEE